MHRVNRNLVVIFYKLFSALGNKKILIQHWSLNELF